MSTLTEAQATATSLTAAQATLKQIGTHPVLKSQLTAAQASNNAVVAALMPPVVPKPVGIAGDWGTPILDSAFTGTALPSPWTAGWWANTAGLSDPVNSAENAAYNNANVTLADGLLNMALTAESITAPGTGKVYPNTGCLISTRGLFQYTYGVAEARIYVPGNAQGTLANWPAFWHTTAPGIAYRETDTFEVLNSVAWAHYHDGTRTAVDGEGVPSKTVIAPGWHTFADEWDATGITFYYDGAAIGKIAATDANQPQYLILDNTVATGLVATPATMQVAYVRVWSITE